MYRTHEQIFSDRIQVKHNPQVKLEFTADDWQLYDTRGREVAAENLNRRIESIINSAFEPRETKYQSCTTALDRWSHYGAADSEGWHMLDFIFRTVYGEGE
jgi:hypothetical protein